MNKFLVVMLVMVCNVAFAEVLDSNGGHMHKNKVRYHCHTEDCVVNVHYNELLNVSLAPRGDIRYSRTDSFPKVNKDNCTNAETNVLIRRSLIPITFSDDGCTVMSGLWYDMYTNRTYTQAKDVKVGYVVPLREVWEAGAWKWSEDELANFMNNMDNLVISSHIHLGFKGDQLPEKWLPFYDENTCQYLETWIRVKANHDLSMTVREKEYLEYRYSSCQ